MRVLLGLILTATVLAGCASTTEDPAPTTTTPITRETYEVPEIPRFDAVEMLDYHQNFVRLYPERDENKPQHELARLALMDLFTSFGLEVYRHNFTNGIDQANILGIKWGVVRDQWVVVGGHYDIVPTPSCQDPLGPAPTPVPCEIGTQGAYDDASGTLMAAFLGKSFASVTPYYTMAFIGYDGEERGLQGAGAFVNDFMVEPVDEDGLNKTPYGAIDIVGAVDLDMIGLNWPGVMAPVNILDNSVTAYDFANTKRLEMGWPDEQWIHKDNLTLGSSDYARFWSVEEDQGGPIATLFMIANFEELGVPSVAENTPPQAHTPAGAYPFWHLEDTVETMRIMAGDSPLDGSHPNLEAGFQAAADIALQVLWGLACNPQIEIHAIVY